jgi:hypothetical protein
MAIGRRSARRSFASVTRTRIGHGADRKCYELRSVSVRVHAHVAVKPNEHAYIPAGCANHAENFLYLSQIGGPVALKGRESGRCQMGTT